MKLGVDFHRLFKIGVASQGCNNPAGNGVFTSTFLQKQGWRIRATSFSGQLHHFLYQCALASVVKKKIWTTFNSFIFHLTLAIQLESSCMLLRLRMSVARLTNPWQLHANCCMSAFLPKCMERVVIEIQTITRARNVGRRVDLGLHNLISNARFANTPAAPCGYMSSVN